MKKINTLISDIQSRLLSGKPFDADTVETFSVNLAKKLANRLSEERGKPSLRLSNLGTPCDRKLWYSINKPDFAEPLPASTRLKFLFGDILEEVVLFLARAAGHTVEKEQDSVEVHGVRGHIDGVIDDELVDVKSASSYSFRKFKDHGLVNDDPFGYLVQLGTYSRGLGKSRAHFLAVDKTLGHITLDTHEFPDKDYSVIVAQKRAMLATATPPPRAYADEPDGKSGNRKLGLACSYCPFKLVCWPGVRAFKYARGPAFLTRVVRQPDVPELRIDQMGDE